MIRTICYKISNIFIITSVSLKNSEYQLGNKMGKARLKIFQNKKKFFGDDK
jgi:hypothetical protein